MYIQSSWFVLTFDFALGTSRIQQVVDSLKVPSCIGAFEGILISWSLGNKQLMHMLRG